MNTQIPVWVLILCVLAAMSPMFFLAAHVDSDEFVKGFAGLGTATITAVVTMFGLYVRGSSKRE